MLNGGLTRIRAFVAELSRSRLRGRAGKYAAGPRGCQTYSGEQGNPGNALLGTDTRHVRRRPARLSGSSHSGQFCHEERAATNDDSRALAQSGAV